MEEETSYATCVNEESCQWAGYSFAPPPDAKGARRCPSCGQELRKWKAPSERKRLEGEDEAS